MLDLWFDLIQISKRDKAHVNNKNSTKDVFLSYEWFENYYILWQ